MWQLHGHSLDKLHTKLPHKFEVPISPFSACRLFSWPTARWSPPFNYTTAGLGHTKDVMQLPPAWKLPFDMQIHNYGVSSPVETDNAHSYNWAWNEPMQLWTTCTPSPFCGSYDTASRPSDGKLLPTGEYGFGSSSFVFHTRCWVAGRFELTLFQRKGANLLVTACSPRPSPSCESWREVLQSTGFL